MQESQQSDGKEQVYQRLVEGHIESNQRYGEVVELVQVIHDKRVVQASLDHCFSSLLIVDLALEAAFLKACLSRMNTLPIIEAVIGASSN